MTLRRLASNSVLRVVDVAVQVLATLWLTPLLIHNLGMARYGLWVTVLTLVSYLDIFDLGLTSAVTRYVSRALGRGDLDAARETVRSAFTILLRIALGCLALVALLAAAVPWIMPDSTQAGPVRAIIVILGITAALSFPMRVFTGVIEAFVRYECTTAASIIRTVLTTGALVWVLHTGGDMIHVVLVVAAGGLLHRALNYFFARQIFPTLRLLPLGTTAEARAELLSYGGKNFLMKLVDLVRFRIDNLLIARFAGIGQVALYAPGMALIRYYREVIDSLGGVMMPVFSRAEGAGDRDKLRAHLVRANRLCAVVAMFIGGSIALYGGLFIERWLGPGFRDSYRVALILAGPFIVAMAQNPGIYMLYGLSKQERLLRLNVIEAVANFALSLALVFRFGIFGVAAGTAISLLITKTLLQPAIMCDETGLSRRTYYFDALLLPLAITAAPMLASYAALSGWLRPDYWRLSVAIAAQALVVAPVVWWVLFGKAERASLSGIFFRKTA